MFISRTGREAFFRTLADFSDAAARATRAPAFGPDLFGEFKKIVLDQCLRAA